VVFRLHKDATWQMLSSNQRAGKCCCAKCVGGSACPCCRRASPTHGKALVEYAGRERARLGEVVDYQVASRHDQLEPPLRIGESANILQWISLDDEQICVSSRGYHAYHALHPQ
jgi:hypothetical protein